MITVLKTFMNDAFNSKKISVYPPFDEKIYTSMLQNVVNQHVQGRDLQEMVVPLINSIANTFGYSSDLRLKIDMSHAVNLDLDRMCASIYYKNKDNFAYN